MDQHFEIAGTGLYLPRIVLSAAEIDRRLGQPEGWTHTHVGVESRHECLPPETLGSMAREAARDALDTANIDWRAVDLIIDGSTSRHQPIPCNGAHLQACFGDEAAGIPCFDVHSTCLGFIMAVHVANGLFAIGSYRHILIVCSEGPLGGVNWREPESAALLGDGAAAVVLRRRPSRPTYHFAHETHAQYLEICSVRGGAHNLPPFAYGPDNDADFRFHMDGSRLFRVACKLLPPLVRTLLESAPVDREHLHVIPHQASPRGVEAIRRQLDLPADRYHNRVATMGNLVSASIPAVLHQCCREQLIGAGDDVMFLGTSAGYAQAATLLRM